MNHYLAILVEDEVGEWRAFFPDMPGCEAKGFSLNDVKFAAATALVRSIRDSGETPPSPMDMATVERNEEWLRQNRIDLSKAVVTMIELAVQLGDDSLSVRLPKAADT